MEISYLADRPHLAAGLIPGLLEHWRPLFPDTTVAMRVERFRAHENRDVLPIAWVAHAGDQVFGTAALRVHDLEGREDLSPWLGGVYVLPHLRRRGIASALCRVVEEKARALGFRRFYLFTPDQARLYAGLGWSPLEQTLWHGVTCQIMAKDLLPPESGAA